MPIDRANSLGLSTKKKGLQARWVATEVDKLDDFSNNRLTADSNTCSMSLKSVLEISSLNDDSYVFVAKLQTARDDFRLIEEKRKDADHGASIVKDEQRTQAKRAIVRAVTINPSQGVT